MASKLKTYGAMDQAMPGSGLRLWLARHGLSVKYRPDTWVLPKAANNNCSAQQRSA